MRWKPVLLLFACAALSAGVLYFYWTVAKSRQPAAPRAAELPEVTPGASPLVTFIDPWKGAEDGTFVIVEYGDHLCPFCREAEKEIDLLLAAHPGKVKFVWKDLPSPVHQGADTAAEAVQCARTQGKFWEMHGELLESLGPFDQASLSLLAGNLGLDTQAFSNCLATREMRYVVERNVEEAMRLGVEAVPAFYLNGKRYTGGITYAELNALVQTR